MNIDDYFDKIRKILESFNIIISHQILIEHRSPEYGKIKIQVDFLDKSTLYLMEFIRCGHIIEKYKFSYHYQNKKGEMIFRYDNSRHYTELSSFPCHKHTGQNKVIESHCPELAGVLQEILNYIQGEQIP